MKLSELKDGIREYLHLEDTGAIDVLLASYLSFFLGLGEPAWLIVVGVSSGGKSQILRPLSVDNPSVFKVDDLTENTLLSGTPGKNDPSLLLEIGPEGVILMNDLTVLFSRNSESRDSILGQLRMVYDGEMTKRVGNSDKPKEWKGRILLVAGCTPSIYPIFQEIADMGERFLYYNLKPLDPVRATAKALASKNTSKNIDEHIGGLYKGYLESIAKAGYLVPELSDAVSNKILNAAIFASRLRTPIKTDERTGVVTRIPFSEMPMRVAKQLKAVAMGMTLMQFHETGTYEINDEFVYSLEWCAYSLGDNERRAILRVLCSLGFLHYFSTRDIGNEVGLDSDVVRRILQALAAIGFVTRMGEVNENLSWRVENEADYLFIRKMENQREVFAQNIEF